VPGVFHFAHFISRQPRGAATTRPAAALASHATLPCYIPPPLYSLEELTLNSTDLTPGMAIKMDGKLFLITETEHRTPGNLRAFVQIKIRDLKSGSLIEKRLRSGEDVEQVDLDRRQMEYLYDQGGKSVFMDLESYDQVELSKEVVGDLALFVLPNTQMIVLWCDGKPISVELPLTVTLEVTDTPPGIKGATATNQLKEAICDTGLKTRVPPFITNGDKIRVSTEDGAYRERA
jgi:elongation factor P